MAWTIIVASGDAAQRAVLADVAGEIAAQIDPVSPPDVAEAPSIEDVQALRRHRPDPQHELILITASLPANPSSPNLRDAPGLHFVEALQRTPDAPACIILSENEDHRRIVDQLPRCRFLSVGPLTSYVDDGLQLAGELGAFPVGTPQPVSDNVRQPYSLIDVFLCDKATRSRAELDVTYPNRERNAAILLNLKQAEVDAIVKTSRKLSSSLPKAWEMSESYSDWHAAYRRLGERVHKLLFTQALSSHYEYARGVAGRDARLRFNLEPGVTDGLWESVCNPKSSEFLMMESTITRRDSGATNHFPSRGAGAIGTLNVLVVGSPVTAGARPIGLDGPDWTRYFRARPLRSLSHIGKDIAALRQVEGLTGLPSSIRVDVINGDETAGRSLADTVEKVLRDRPARYDAIHFVGNAVFAPSTSRKAVPAQRRARQQGYLIFSGAPQPRAVPIATVARWIKGTTVELVYLSCCRSDSGRAAAEFAYNDVRMTIGFNWDLDDERTEGFTRGFYEQLLRSGLRVCSAIRAVRESSRDSDNHHPIWASSLLFAQPSRWLEIEGVLRPPNRRPNRVKPSLPGQPNSAVRGEPPPMPELSPANKRTLVQLLAKKADAAELHDGEYFRNLVRQAAFTTTFRQRGGAGYRGVPDADALRLVDWALGVGTNPGDRNHALGTILLQLLDDDLGVEDRTFIAGLVVAYRLVRSESAIEELRTRYQIPDRSLADEAVDLGPAVNWTKETIDLQGWFAPEPDWLDVGTITTAARRARSVCRVETATGGRGTGILVGANLVLTNYHVLAGNLTAAPDVLIRNAAGTNLRFGAFAPAVEHGASDQAVGLAEMAPIVDSSAEHDFVLLRTADSIDRAINVEPFASLGAMPRTKQALNVLQHPEGGPMKLALSASGVTWVDPGGLKVQYTTKVARGSSGSPCFDADWNLVALHHAGSKSLGEGMLIAAIFDRIKQYLK